MGSRCPMYNLGELAITLQRTMRSLKRWILDKFGAVTSELVKLRKRLEELNAQDPMGNQNEISSISKQMDELLYRVEMMWLQRSCILWLKEGDHNTNFFHQKAVGRMRKNKIKFLTKVDGQITRDRKEMQSMASNFLEDLYTADLDVNPQELLHLFQPMILEEMNEGLCKEYG
jgi:hypothetical protein